MTGVLGDEARRDLESGDEQHVQKMVEGVMHHNYVELKTTEWIDDRLQDKKKIQQKLNNYDRRKIKYWGQSYLIGCPTIIVGKKDENQQSTMPLEVLKTNNIPATNAVAGRFRHSVGSRLLSPPQP
ncbi:decapping endonuclease targeting mRNA [Diplodia seriata]